jgi:hypothetical protein
VEYFVVRHVSTCRDSNDNELFILWSKLSGGVQRSRFFRIAPPPHHAPPHTIRFDYLIHSPHPSPPFCPLVGAHTLTLTPILVADTSQAVKHLPSKTLPNVSAQSKYALDSPLSSLSSIHPPYPYPHLTPPLPHPTTSNRLAGLTSPIQAHALPQPTADETRCRPTKPSTHEETRRLALYHQSGYTAPLPSALTSGLPTLPRRCCCCEIARALCWQPAGSQRPSRSICLCLLRLVSQAIRRGLFVSAHQYKALVVDVAAATLVLGCRQKEEPYSQHQ